MAKSAFALKSPCFLPLVPAPSFVNIEHSRRALSKTGVLASSSILSSSPEKGDGSISSSVRRPIHYSFSRTAHLHLNHNTCHTPEEDPSLPQSRPKNNSSPRGSSSPRVAMRTGSMKCTDGSFFSPHLFFSRSLSRFSSSSSLCSTFVRLVATLVVVLTIALSSHHDGVHRGNHEGMKKASTRDGGAAHDEEGGHGGGRFTSYGGTSSRFLLFNSLLLFPYSSVSLFSSPFLLAEASKFMPLPSLLLPRPPYKRASSPSPVISSYGLDRQEPSHNSLRVYRRYYLSMCIEIYLSL